MSSRPRDRSTLEGIAASYLDVAGVIAAALVSTEGLIVASAGDSSADFEGMAAHAASTLESALDLAREAGASPRRVTLSLPGRILVIAPLTADLFLLLLGRDEMLGAGVAQERTFQTGAPGA